MYGFGGVGQVEARFGQMSPWQDERTTNRTTEQGKIELLSHGPWKAEMSKNEVTSQFFGRLSLCLMRGNAIMLSSRSPDQDIPVPEIDGVL